MIATAFVLLGAICDGSSGCKTSILTSIIAGGLVLALAALLAVRFVRVNAKRRAAGRGALRWRAIADARVDNATMIGADAATFELETAGLARQIEWERRQASIEMMRYGRSRTRAYCRMHDRHCRNPIEQPHPPGGIDNDGPPEDWTP